MTINDQLEVVAACLYRLWGFNFAEMWLIQRNVLSLLNLYLLSQNSISVNLFFLCHLSESVKELQIHTQELQSISDPPYLFWLLLNRKKHMQFCINPVLSLCK